MTSHRPLAVALMGAFALSACGQGATEPPATVEPPVTPVAAPTGPLPPPIAYACQSDQSVQVQYPDSETAQVTWRGQAYTLRIAPSGSGARYVGSGLEWWTASRNGQENATLSRIDPNDQVGTTVLETCSRPSANPDLPPPGADPASATGAVATPCRVSDLRLSVETADAGAGNRVQVFGLTNTGATPCAVSGYPAVSLLDSQGRPLSTVRSDQNPDTATPVVVPAGGRAFFDIAWTVVPNEAEGQTSCPSAARVSIRIVGDASTMATPLALTPCGGRIRVNPLRATEEVAAPPAST